MSKNVTFRLINNTYYIFVGNKILLSQPIVASSYIPSLLSASAYWYFYVLLVASRFGLVSRFNLPLSLRKTNNKSILLNK